MEFIKLDKGLCHVCGISNIQLYSRSGIITCKKCKGKTPTFLINQKKKQIERDRARYGFAE